MLGSGRFLPVDVWARRKAIFLGGVVDAAGRKHFCLRDFLSRVVFLPPAVVARAMPSAAVLAQLVGTVAARSYSLDGALGAAVPPETLAERVAAALWLGEAAPSFNWREAVAELLRQLPRDAPAALALLEGLRHDQPKSAGREAQRWLYTRRLALEVLVAMGRMTPPPPPFCAGGPPRAALALLAVLARAPAGARRREWITVVGHISEALEGRGPTAAAVALLAARTRLAVGPGGGSSRVLDDLLRLAVQVYWTRMLPGGSQAAAPGAAQLARATGKVLLKGRGEAPGALGSGTYFCLLEAAQRAGDGERALTHGEAGDEEAAARAETVRHGAALQAGTRAALLFTCGSLSASSDGSSRRGARRQVHVDTLVHSLAGQLLARLDGGAPPAALQLLIGMRAPRAMPGAVGATGRAVAHALAVAAERLRQRDAPLLSLENVIAGCASNGVLLSVGELNADAAQLHRLPELLRGDGVAALFLADFCRLPDLGEEDYLRSLSAGLRANQPTLLTMETAMAASLLDAGLCQLAGGAPPSRVVALLRRYVSPVGALRATALGEAQARFDAGAAALTRVFIGYWSRYGRERARVDAARALARAAARELGDEEDAAALEASLAAEAAGGLEEARAACAEATRIQVDNTLALVAAAQRRSTADVLAALAREHGPEEEVEQVDAVLAVAFERTSPSKDEEGHVNSGGRQDDDSMTLLMARLGVPPPPPPAGQPAWAAGQLTPAIYAAYWAPVNMRQYRVMLTCAIGASRDGDILTRLYTDLHTGVVYTGQQLVDLLIAFAVVPAQQAWAVAADSSRGLAGLNLERVLSMGRPALFAHRPRVCLGDLAAAAALAPAAAAPAPGVAGILAGAAAVGGALAGGGWPAHLLRGALWVETDSLLARAVVGLFVYGTWVRPWYYQWLAQHHAAVFA